MQPPPGVAIDRNELLQFEGLRHEHELAPKDPSKVHINMEYMCLCACITCEHSYLTVAIVCICM